MKSGLSSLKGKIWWLVVHIGGAYWWCILVVHTGSVKGLLTGWFVLSARQVTRNEVLYMEGVLDEVICLYQFKFIGGFNVFWLAGVMVNMFMSFRIEISGFSRRVLKKLQVFILMKKCKSIFPEAVKNITSLYVVKIVFVDSCKRSWKNYKSLFSDNSVCRFFKGEVEKITSLYELKKSFWYAKSVFQFL